jgi:thiol-disulfide isomerase/thioredoxin
MRKQTVRFFWTAALLLLAAVLVLVNLPGKTPPAGAEPGELLPDFSVACVDGSEFRLSEQRGRVVVINLWATWCTPCVRELPNFDRLSRERGEAVAVLAMHTPPVTADVAEYLSAFSYTMPFAVDETGELAEMLGASTVLPQTLILDSEGLVTYNRVGALSYEELCALVDAAGGAPG